MPDKTYISKITLPSGNTYDIKDAEVREMVGNLSGAMKYGGITTTPLTDGSTTATITIDGQSKSFAAADAGSVVVYGEDEFIWNGSKWQRFGVAGSFKALAFKDSADGDFTPTGTVTVTTATTSNKTATVSAADSGTATYTPGGSVTAPTFTGSSATINVSGTFEPTGTVNLTTSSKSATVTSTTGTATYTPAGNITNMSVVPTLSQITPFGTAGEDPSCTLPTLTTTVANETLTLSWTSGSWSAGKMPTAGTPVSVATGISSATASFSGTGVRLVTGNIDVPTSASFVGGEGAISASGTYTPSGTNGTPTFTGSAVRLVTGNIAVPSTYSATFVGGEGTVTVS